MKVVVIHTNGTIYIDHLSRPIWRSAGVIVDGPIEIVYPRRLKRPYCMICNEEFLLLGLPLNPVGSYLYGTEQHGQPICGNIIISKIKGDDLEGLTDVETRDILKTIEALKLQLREE